MCLLSDRMTDERFKKIFFKSDNLRKKLIPNRTDLTSSEFDMQVGELSAAETDAANSPRLYSRRRDAVERCFKRSSSAPPPRPSPSRATAAYYVSFFASRFSYTNNLLLLTAQQSVVFKANQFACSQSTARHGASHLWDDWRMFLFSRCHRLCVWRTINVNERNEPNGDVDFIARPDLFVTSSFDV